MAKKSLPAPVAVIEEPDTRPLLIRNNFARGAIKAEIAEQIIRSIKAKWLVRPNGTRIPFNNPVRWMQFCIDAVQEFNRLDKEDGK